MASIPQTPRRSRPKSGHNPELHDHSDLSSGGRIKATDLIGIVELTAVQDHGLLLGLGDDDHAQYLLLAGRVGGQTAYGGTVASNDLTLSSTAHATKDRIFLGSAQASAFDELNNRLGIGQPVPEVKLHVLGNPQPSYLTLTGDDETVDGVNVKEVTDVTLNGTTTITKAGAFASIGGSPDVEGWRVTGTGIPAGAYVVLGGIAPNTLVLSAAATISGLSTLSFHALDASLGRYPNSSVYGFPGSSWEYLTTNDGADSEIARHGDVGSYARNYELSGVASGASWTITYVAKRQGTIPPANGVYSFTIYNSVGDSYVSDATLLGSALTTSWAEYTTTVSTPGSTGNPPNILRLGVGVGTFFDGYIEFTQIRVSGGAANSEAAVTLFERSAASDLPYSIWRDESDVTVASINSTGAGQFQNVLLEDPGAGTGTVSLIAPAGVTSYSLTLPANDGNNLDVLQTNGTGTLSWATFASLLDDDLEAIGALTGTGLLQRTATDTWALIAPVRGSIPVGNATPLYAALAVGAAGSPLFSDGTDATWTNGPTWTGLHTWTRGSDATAITINSFSNAGTSALLQALDTSAVRLFDVAPSGTVSVSNTTSALTGVKFQVRAPAAQVGNIAQILLAGSSVWTIGPSGKMVCTTLAPQIDIAAAAAGSIAYSTDVDGNFQWSAAGAATQVLHGGAVPSWSAVSLTADVTGTLPAANLPGTFSGFATPTADVDIDPQTGGSATTAMRSDAKLQLSQAIAPTWTGQHIYDPTAGVALTLKHTGAVVNNFLEFYNSSAVRVAYINYAGQGLLESLYLGTDTINARLRTSFLTGQRVLEAQDLSGSILIIGNGADPPSAGGIASLSRILNGNVSTPVNLTNASPPGFYLLTVYISCTTAGDGMPTYSITYTDDIATQTNQPIVTLGSMNVGDYVSGSFMCYLASGNITWTCSGYVSTGVYKLKVRAAYMGN